MINRTELDDLTSKLRGKLEETANFVLFVAWLSFFRMVKKIELCLLRSMRSTLRLHIFYRSHRLCRISIIGKVKMKMKMMEKVKPKEDFWSQETRKKPL